MNNNYDAVISALIVNVNSIKERVCKLENFTQPLDNVPEPDPWADIKQPGKTASELFRERESELKCEIKDNSEEIQSLKAKLEQVKRDRDAFKFELDNLKANNRYQTGFNDGAKATIRQVREMAEKLKP